jgi:hypothetical protein
MMRPPATNVRGRILVVNSPSGNGSRSTPTEAARPGAATLSQRSFRCDTEERGESSFGSSRRGVEQTFLVAAVTSG